MPSSRPSTADKRRAFRKLHDSGCFVIPNPWNVGTARYLQGLGFKALASTSAGFAHAQGFADGDVPRDMMLAHFREIAEAADVPVNADFENGYAHDPEGVARNVARCIETGVAGLSIEDYTGDDADPLYDFDLALARVKAALEVGVERQVGGRGDLGEVSKNLIARLRAIGETLRMGVARTGGRQRLEAEALQIAGGADVPRIGNDEAAGIMQAPEGVAFFCRRRVGHGKSLGQKRARTCHVCAREDNAIR